MNSIKFNVIITTHASLCEGYLDACRLILSSDFEGVDTLPFKANMDVDVYEQQLQSLIEKSSAQPLLILTDLIGGTPSNVAAKYSDNLNIEIVTGVNLSLILEVLAQQENGASIQELNLDTLIEHARKGLISITQLMRGGIQND